jgi:hypothetical protein
VSRFARNGVRGAVLTRFTAHERPQFEARLNTARAPRVTTASIVTPSTMPVKAPMNAQLSTTSIVTAARETPRRSHRSAPRGHASRADHPTQPEGFPDLDVVVVVLAPAAPLSVRSQIRERVLQTVRLPGAWDDDVAVEAQAPQLPNFRGDLAERAPRSVERVEFREEQRVL